MCMWVVKLGEASTEEEHWELIPWSWIPCDIYLEVWIQTHVDQNWSLVVTLAHMKLVLEVWVVVMMQEVKL